MLRPELRPYYDGSLLVEAPREERLRRLRARGNDEDWIARWDPAEQWYFENEFSRAGLVAILSGASLDRPETSKGE